MKKAENALEVTLVLPKNFKSQVLSAMNDEFAEACKKWGLSLNTEDKKRVIENSLEQLSSKVSLVARRPWKLGDTELTVIITYSKKGVFPITLPSKEAKKYTVSFVRAHDEWKVEQDSVAEAIHIKDFHRFFTGEVVKWARTAVFYGVGSFA